MGYNNYVKYNTSQKNGDHGKTYFVEDTSILQIFVIWQYMKRKYALIVVYIPIDSEIYKSILE